MTTRLKSWSKRYFEQKESRAFGQLGFIVDGGSFYKRPTCPKKVRVITGRRARRNAIETSSFAFASTAACWQVVQLSFWDSTVSVVTSDIRLYVSCFYLPSAGFVKEGVEKEKTGCRRGRPHPFFTSQHIYYSTLKGESQPRTYFAVLSSAKFKITSHYFFERAVLVRRGPGYSPAHRTKNRRQNKCGVKGRCLIQ